MKNKKLFIFILVVILFLCLFIPSLIDYFNYSNLPDEVIIYDYNYTGNKEINEILVTDKEEIKNLSRYVKKMEAANNVDIRLALLEDVKIKYNDSIMIGIQLGEEEYCYYINNGKSKLVRIPGGFYKWITKNMGE